MPQTDKLLILAGIIFFFLLNYPLVHICNVPTMVAGVPLGMVYLLLVWILTIVCLFLFGRWLRSRGNRIIKP